MDLEQQQLELEQEMMGAGLTRFIKNLERAVAQGDESVTPYGRAAMLVAIKPLADAIDEMCNGKQKAGRKHQVISFIKDMDPLVVAFLTIKSAIDSVSDRRSLQHASVLLGARIEDEIRFTKFHDENPGLYQVVLDDLRKRTSNLGHQRTVMVHTMNQKSGVEWERWDVRAKLLVGKRLLELMAEHVGIIRIIKVTVKHNDRRYFIEATDAMMDAVENLNRLIHDHKGVYTDERTNKQFSIFTPAYCPTIVPPKRWTELHDGGYFVAARTRNTSKLIKNAPLTTLEDIENTVDMSQVYTGINIMQETAWRVNDKVLEVLEEKWLRNHEVGKVPPRKKDDIPPRTFALPEIPCPRTGKMVVHREVLSPDEEQRFTAWKRTAAMIHRKNAGRIATVLQVQATIDTARRFRQFERIYFPYQLDFRGRAYALPMFLNPQGPDYAKALLTFANGKPIEDETALGYLMIHGANCFGVDKVSFQDRIAWVEENEDAILRAGTDPLLDSWWQDADEPWQFLAFCIEYAEFQAHGYGYVSHLPVALDGSCNGIQHFSAMLRDPIGGAAVNLLDSEVPADIYQQVADVARRKVEALIPDGTDELEGDALMASQWLDFGIDRKIVKRSVMILPYGGTIKACRDYIAEAAAERADDEPWEMSDRSKAAAWLSKYVWKAIDEVVVAAREAMAWLRQVAGLVSKGEGKPIVWYTPDGFPVYQAYRNVKITRVATVLGESSRVRIKITEPTETFDARRQKNGISPNFVHSMDACVLRQYAIKAWEAGIDSFSLVHDSFGTLAADAALSAQCNRNAFVDLYQGHDVLSEFAEAVAPLSDDPLPELPATGTLDLELTRSSRYFIA